MRTPEFSESKKYPSPCLVGLQAFIGLQRIAVTGEFLIVLSKFSELSMTGLPGISPKKTKQPSKSSEEVIGWNLYILHSTSLTALYEDIISRAESYVSD
jgi:hypothetical protein